MVPQYSVKDPDLNPVIPYPDYGASEHEPAHYTGRLDRMADLQQQRETDGQRVEGLNNEVTLFNSSFVFTNRITVSTIS